MAICSMLDVGYSPDDNSLMPARTWRPKDLKLTVDENYQSLTDAFHLFGWIPVKTFAGRLPSGKRIKVTRNGIKKTGYRYRIKVKARP